MPANSGAISGTVAHKHSLPSSDGGFLDDGVTGVTGTGNGSLIYFDASGVAQNLSAGVLGQTLTMGAAVPAWGSAGAVGSWVELANQDDGSSFVIGGSGDTLFDDYKYIQVIYDFKQTGSDYVEFNWFDTVGTVTGNAQLYQWMEAAALNPPGGYVTSTNPSRVGYIENANIIFGEFLFQTQTTGSHQMVHFKTNCSGNNAIQQFQGVLWLGTSNRIRGMEYAGLGSITASTCSYKCLGLT